MYDRVRILHLGCLPDTYKGSLLVFVSLGHPVWDVVKASKLNETGAGEWPWQDAEGLWSGYWVFWVDLGSLQGDKTGNWRGP
jgi:hypothetical protein